VLESLTLNTKIEGLNPAIGSKRERENERERERERKGKKSEHYVIVGKQR
jgi:hypothetical protein